jgi:hypothetical protein
VLIRGQIESPSGITKALQAPFFMPYFQASIFLNNEIGD